MRRALLLLVVLAGLVAACEDKYKDPDPKAMGYDYYPLEEGDWRIYNVTDIRYMSNVGDTTRFQLRERVDTTFLDQTGALNYKIIRSVRDEEGDEWVDDSVMTVVKTELNVILTKNNTKYVKLVFPIKEGKEWVGDAYNNNLAFDYAEKVRNGKELYSFSNIGVSYDLNGISYPNTVEVIHGDYHSDDVNLDERKEVYAKDIGLIYRYHNVIVFCNQTESKDCVYGIGFKLHGHERHEELISHGKE
ncbi:hypothetical protein [Pontibacter mangrovi]|uniref:Uncharacterized protein n=1 Tax=Pontibacter mangrovi TaxID=2589816 RepID=A0A501W340_9BACT|nr:hypothetical protein [Pontibacter mangrovi]TPE43172.1 hypothetical protein FJM65_13710 [Pontibacter mangrovi]